MAKPSVLPEIDDWMRSGEDPMRSNSSTPHSQVSGTPQHSSCRVSISLHSPRSILLALCEPSPRCCERLIHKRLAPNHRAARKVTYPAAQHRRQLHVRQSRPVAFRRIHLRMNQAFLHQGLAALPLQCQPHRPSVNPRNLLPPLGLETHAGMAHARTDQSLSRLFPFPFDPPPTAFRNCSNDTPPDLKPSRLAPDSRRYKPPLSGLRFRFPRPGKCSGKLPIFPVKSKVPADVCYLFIPARKKSKLFLKS
jgi:hypothetical protein